MEQASSLNVKFYRMPHLDVWRFIAISLVIQGHVLIFGNFRFIVASYPFLRRLGRFAELGVLIFFFISGFVICRGLILELSENKRISLKAFWLRRILRIIPPLYLYLGVLAILGPAFGLADITIPEIRNSALFLCNLELESGCSFLVTHTWSLAYEEQFYLLFPVIFIAASLTVRPSLLLWGCISLMFIASLFRFYSIDWAASYLSYMIFMLFGCAVALYWERIKGAVNVRTGWWFLAVVILVCLVGLAPYPTDRYLQVICYPPLIAVIVLLTPVSTPLLSMIFSSQFLAYLGRISYTVYLWQQLACKYYSGLSQYWSLLFIVLVWVFAHLSYLFYERPIMKFSNKLSSEIKRMGKLEGN